MGLRLMDKMSEFLEQNPEQGFLAREIAKWVFENYPDECRKKRERSKAKITPIDTDDNAFIQQLSSEIRPRFNESRQTHPEVRATKDKPLKYYYTEISDSVKIKKTTPKQAISKNAKKKNATPEADLYPMLWKYLLSLYPKIYTKRIDEGRSSNSNGPGGNEWLHPDLVGVEVLGEGWSEGIQEYEETCSNTKNKLKLWSFEVKETIESGERLRKSFFQAVSNSTWANFGYLVAGKIESVNRKKREYIMSELRILSNLHGIGFIELNTDNPLDSRIIIPAKERKEVDWNTADRLFKENPDFREYMREIRLYHKDGWNEDYWNRLEKSR